MKMYEYRSVFGTIWYSQKKLRQPELLARLRTFHLAPGTGTIFERITRVTK